MLMSNIAKTSRRDNMINKIFVSIVVAMLLSGCTRTFHSSNYYYINHTATGKQAEITLVWGNKFQGEILYIDADSTRWVDAKIRRYSVPTNHVKSIGLINRSKGAQDAFLGVLSGSILIAASIANGPKVSSNSSGYNFNLSPENQAKVVGVYGTILAALVGAPLGALAGSQDLYMINEQSGIKASLQSPDSLESRN